jgi:hypothetical protein
VLALDAEWPNAAQWTARRIVGDYLDDIRLHVSLVNGKRSGAAAQS